MPPRPFEQCLWAKTFHDTDAADIGNATVCHQDYAIASACNPNMRMERTRTLMKGDEYCIHRWLFEGAINTDDRL